MKTIKVALDLHQEGADAQYLDEQVGAMIRQLSSPEIQVLRSTTIAPDSAKSAAGSVISTILLTCATSPALAELINYLKAWLERRKGRGIRLSVDGSTIELSGQVNEEKIAIITQWLEAASQGDDDD